MEALFRSVLRLYPANVRDLMGAEMLEVFREGRDACSRYGALFEFRFYARELAGILRGMLREHARNLLPSFDNFVPIGRSFMRSGMKFPISAVVFMVLSFLGVMYAIFEAEAVSAAVPKGNPTLELRPVHIGMPGADLMVMLGIAYLLGIVGWLVLFSLRRAGAERLSQTETWTAAK